MGIFAVIKVSSDFTTREVADLTRMPRGNGTVLTDVEYSVGGPKSMNHSSDTKLRRLAGKLTLPCSYSSL